MGAALVPEEGVDTPSAIDPGETPAASNMRSRSTTEAAVTTHRWSKIEGGPVKRLPGQRRVLIVTGSLREPTGLSHPPRGRASA